MKIGIFVTNTDVSPFALARPLDGEKFTTLLAQHRPDWDYEVFDVKSDEFPENSHDLDGILITGSPASVHDDAQWISKLRTLIQDYHSKRKPMFGACFGHQIIALALGGTVSANPNGWQHGAIENTQITDVPWGNMPKHFILYGSHKEQVTKLPETAETIFESTDCTCAGIRIGNHIFTTQHHPEMSDAFITDLVEEYSEALGPEITNRARNSLKQSANGADFGLLIAQFFECAQ